MWSVWGSVICITRIFQIGSTACPLLGVKCSRCFSSAHGRRDQSRSKPHDWRTRQILLYAAAQSAVAAQAAHCAPEPGEAAEVAAAGGIEAAAVQLEHRQRGRQRRQQGPQVRAQVPHIVQLQMAQPGEVPQHVRQRLRVRHVGPVSPGGVRVHGADHSPRKTVAGSQRACMIGSWKT